MRYKIIYTLLLTTISSGAYSQEKFTLSGTINMKTSTETIIGASIFIPGAKASTITNAYGFYSLTLPKGEYTIVISCVGFETIEEHIVLAANTRKNFSMLEKSKNLNEVVVKYNGSASNIQKPEMSVNKLSISTIKKMPAVMGEVDVLRAIL